VPLAVKQSGLDSKIYPISQGGFKKCDGEVLCSLIIFERICASTSKRRNSLLKFLAERVIFLPGLARENLRFSAGALRGSDRNQGSLPGITAQWGLMSRIENPTAGRAEIQSAQMEQFCMLFLYVLVMAPGRL